MVNFFYLENFQGLCDSGTADLPAIAAGLATGIVRLPDQPCRLVQLHNWNVGDDTSFTAKATAGGALVEDDLQEIYYGFNGKFCGQIFQGRSSEIMPINNLSQIIVRSRPAQSGKVYYSWWW